MGFKMRYAIALSGMLLFGSAASASAQGYYGPDGAHCYGGYVSVGSHCVPAGSREAYRGYRPVQCPPPYVSVNNRCVMGRGGRGYYAHERGRRPRGYMGRDGAHCYAPYVSVGSHCVRAY